MRTKPKLPIISVAIADDHTIKRWALCEVLERAEDFTVAGGATNADEALALAAKARPDIMIVDLNLPGRGGLELLMDLAQAHPAVRVLVLSAQEDTAYAVRTMRLGAAGFVRKATAPEELLVTLRAIHRGERVAPPEVLAALASVPPSAATSGLSQREHQVMEMLARGATNREIADELAISVKTVDTHRGHVLKKLRLRNNSDLTRYAIRHGYVDA